MATDYYQLRLQGLHQTEYNECVLFFKGVNLDAAEYLENARDLLLTFESECLGDWANMFPTSYQLCRNSARKASAGGGGEISQQFPIGSQPGAQSGGAASQQLCPVVRLIPGMGIKTAGKIFLPCIAEGDVGANVVTSGWLTRLDAMMGPLISGISAVTIVWSLVVYSRKNNTFSDILTYDTSPIIGFQRRRQRSPL